MYTDRRVPVAAGISVVNLCGFDPAWTIQYDEDGIERKALEALMTKIRFHHHEERKRNRLSYAASFACTPIIGQGKEDYNHSDQPFSDRASIKP